jgi:uncharacterized protein YbjT (DUF2867 family)
MSGEIITLFGGSGFIGTQIVRALCKRDYRVRVAVRRPHVAQKLKVIGDVGQVQLVQANVRHPESIARAMEGASAVINCVGILYEQGRQDFDEIHTDGPSRIAKAAAEAGIDRLVHISAIGADAASASEYARTKAAGEAAIRDALPNATILRPSVVFGPEDNFFNFFASMARFAPALPAIGGAKTRFQPVYVGDVAEAAARALTLPGAEGAVFELGGPKVYTFRQLLELMLTEIDRPRFLAPIPFFLALPLGKILEVVGSLPFVPTLLTADQVVQLQSDNVVATGARGLADFGITPTSVEAILPTYMTRYRKGGQFHQKGEAV